MDIIRQPRGWGKTTLAAIITKHLPDSVMVVDSHQTAGRVIANFGLPVSKVEVLSDYQRRLGHKNRKVIFDEIGQTVKLPYGLSTKNIDDDGLAKIVKSLTHMSDEVILATDTK